MLNRSILMTIGSLVLLMTGCTTLEESYAGRDASQVWTAMVAVAESPEYYQDWFIMANDVWADDTTGRIEIHRRIERDVIKPRMKPQHQNRTWQHQIYLFEVESGPLVTFRSRGWGVPVLARQEAENYFADIWEILGGKPEVIEDIGETDDAVSDEEDVDVDSISD